MAKLFIPKQLWEEFVWSRLQWLPSSCRTCTKCREVLVWKVKVKVNWIFFLTLFFVQHNMLLDMTWQGKVFIKSYVGLLFDTWQWANFVCLYCNLVAKVLWDSSVPCKVSKSWLCPTTAHLPSWVMWLFILLVDFQESRSLLTNCLAGILASSLCSNL